MTVLISDISPRKAARLAGIGYLVIIIAGIFAEFFVRSRLIVWGDAATTAGNIIASEGLFRVGIAGDLIMLIFDAVVALALYVLLKPVNRSIALLAVFFRLIHTAVCGINLLNPVMTAQLLSGADFLAVFDSGQLHALAMLFLDAHRYGYILGLVFFGGHCLLLGYLVYRSGYMPKIIGVLLVIASLAYLTDSFANILLSNYAAYADIFLMIVAFPAIVAELSFTLWLLIRGGKLTITPVAAG